LPEVTDAHKRHRGAESDGRYDSGVSNISGVSDVVGDLKNRNWTLQAGIGFKLGS